MPIKEQKEFVSSTYEQAGLKGPPTGVKLIEWSYDSQFLATKCESAPNAVWIWDMTKLELNTLLIHMDQVRSIKFSPNSQTLIIGTGKSRVFVWTPKGACVVDLPKNDITMQTPKDLNVSNINWNPRGSNLVFSDGQMAILSFP